MGMMINRRRVMGGKSLPYDAEIEYLESSGTQWIDTGFKHNQDTRFVTQMSFVSANGWNYPFGSYGGPRSAYLLFCLELNGAKQLSSYYNTPTSKAFKNSNVGTIYNIDFNKNIHTIDNINKTFQKKAFSSIYNDLIFACTDYNGNVTSYVHCRFYYFKIYDDGVLVRDFIPVRIGTTGYMYDKVSKQLFGNSGTGDFILGPDK